MTISKDTYTYKAGEEDKEVFMSYGLLNKLATLVGNPENIAALLVNMPMQESALKMVVGEDNYALLSRDTALSLTRWVADHVLGFMISSFEELQELSGKFKDRTDKLQKALGASESSPDGSAS